MNGTVTHNLAILRGILARIEEGMPRKYQNPKLEIRSDVKRPYYFIRVTIPGIEGTRRRVAKILGFCDQMTRKDAQKTRAEVLDVVNAGRLFTQARMKFRDLAKQYKAARLPQFGSGTQQWQLSLIDNHLIPAFGEFQIIDIDKPAVEAFLMGKGTDGLSWWTRKALRSVLGSMFGAAKDWNLWSGDSPTIGVRIGRKKEVREKRLLNADQVKMILAAVSEDTRLMILTALLLGLRISEVCGLQWGDIDFTSGTLTVRRRWYRGDLDEPKTEASRRVRELGPLLGEFGRRRRNGKATDYIFAENDIPVDERDVLRYELRPVLKRLKLYYPGFGWHAFRRANVTLRQTIGGATPLEAQKAAGHARVDVTMLYTLTDAERDRDQVQAIFDSLIGPTAGPKQ